MMKKMLHRLFWVGLVGTVMALVMLSLFGYVGSHHNSEQGTTLSVGPNPASPGTTVMVTGLKYAAMKKVEVYFQNRMNGVVNTMTNAGGFFDVALKLPKKYNSGPSYIYVVSGTSIMKTPLHFAKPSLAYTFASKFAGNDHLQSFARVNGTGFVANEPIDFNLYDTSKTLNTGNVTTDYNGKFTLSLDLTNVTSNRSLTLAVGNTSAADNNSRQPVSIHIAYVPHIQLNPTSGPVYTRVRISGNGFGQDEYVVISFQGTAVNRVRTNGAGSFSTIFSVPSLGNSGSVGDNVRAVGRRSEAVATAFFQVTPSVSLSSHFVIPKQLIAVSGSQFSPNGVVQGLLVDPNSSGSAVGIPLGTVTASAFGSFYTTFSIPSTVTRFKRYNILLVDEQSGLSSTSYIYVI
jgi:hypothetical protein